MSRSTNKPIDDDLRWFPKDSYDRVSRFDYRDWAFQIAFRRGLWDALISLPYDRRAFNWRDFETQRQVRKGIDLLGKQPVVERAMIELHNLSSLYFFEIDYVFDTITRTSHPDIVEPTLGELEDLVKSARRKAETQPSLCGCKSAEEAHDHAEYWPIHAFLTAPKRLFLITQRGIDMIMRMQFESLIWELPGNPRDESHDRNALTREILKTTRVLPYMDLLLWATHHNRAQELRPSTTAGVIFNDRKLHWKITRQTGPLAERLLHHMSRESQELIVRAAIEHAAEHAKWGARLKRGRKRVFRLTS